MEEECQNSTSTSKRFYNTSSRSKKKRFAPCLLISAATWMSVQYNFWLYGTENCLDFYGHIDVFTEVRSNKILKINK